MRGPLVRRNACLHALTENAFPNRLSKKRALLAFWLDSAKPTAAVASTALAGAAVPSSPCSPPPPYFLMQATVCRTGTAAPAQDAATPASTTPYPATAKG